MFSQIAPQIQLPELTPDQGLVEGIVFHHQHASGQRQGGLCQRRSRRQGSHLTQGEMTMTDLPHRLPGQGIAVEPVDSVSPLIALHIAKGGDADAVVRQIPRLAEDEIGPSRFLPHLHPQ
ncbi:hypothetical protein D3C76_1059620 [compost metagenome]